MSARAGGALLDVHRLVEARTPLSSQERASSRPEEALVQ
jgi:hypothetical protein